MRLARIGVADHESCIVQSGDAIFDVSESFGDFDASFFRDGGLDRLKTGLEQGTFPVATTEETRFGSPIRRPGKIVAVGLNYHEHARETGAAIPDEPVLFMKAPNTVIGPHDDVLIPPGSAKTDWEVELAVVIGATARYLPTPVTALDYVAGYAISNDVSERAFQLERGGQWDKGKSCETFNPLGPWIVTADEIPDPQTLGLRLWVNEELRQSGNTGDMAFSVAYLVWYISQFMVLEPGDLINTGTPAGVALGQPIPVYLRDGDIVTLEIDQLGRQTQTFRQATP